jgi:hypothetical protein
VQRTSLMLLRREGVLLKAIEAGLLTLGSSYLPMPSQRLTRQWLMRLAFVPDYSGASVRELHPLPACFTSIAITEKIQAKISHPRRQMSKQFCGQHAATHGVGRLAKVLSDGLSLKETGEAWCTRVAVLFVWTFTGDRVGAHLDAGVHLQRPQRLTRRRWTWINGSGSSHMNYGYPLAKLQR